MDDFQPTNLSETQPDPSPASPARPEIPRAPMHSAFLGPDGLLRAGWRFLIYVIAFSAILAAMSFASRLLIHTHAHQRPPLWVVLVSEVEMLIAAIIPALFFARYEKRPFGTYGLPSRGAFGRNFRFGLLWGICAISLLLALMRGAHIFYFGGLAQHGVRILKFGAFWGVMFLAVGFAEEFLTRGYTQFTLAQGMGFWPAALLLSFTFGALHFPQEYKLGDMWGAYAGALGAACIGLFFCLTLRRTGSLWFAIGMHASWDWGESFLYSVPDSGNLTPGHLLSSSFHGKPWLTGGPVGPEASILVFVLIALMWLVFDRVYPARKVQATS